MQILKQILYIFLIKNFQAIKLTFLYEQKELLELGLQINFAKNTPSDIINLIIQKNIYKYISIFTKFSLNQKYIGTQISLNTKFNLNISIDIYKKINLNLKKIYIDFNIEYINKEHKILPKLIKLNILDIIISKNETIQNPNIKIDNLNQVDQLNQLSQIDKLIQLDQLNINNNKIKEIYDFINNIVIPETETETETETKTKNKKQNYRLKKITKKKKGKKNSINVIPFSRTQKRAIIKVTNNKEIDPLKKELSTKSKKTFLKEIKTNPLNIETTKDIKEIQSEKSEETNKITSEKTSIFTDSKKNKLNNTKFSIEPSNKSTKKSKTNNKPTWRY